MVWFGLPCYSVIKNGLINNRITFCASVDDSRRTGPSGIFYPYQDGTDHQAEGS